MKQHAAAMTANSQSSDGVAVDREELDASIHGKPRLLRLCLCLCLGIFVATTLTKLRLQQLELQQYKNESQQYKKYEEEKRHFDTIRVADEVLLSGLWSSNEIHFERCSKDLRSCESDGGGREWYCAPLLVLNISVRGSTWT